MRLQDYSIYLRSRKVRTDDIITVNEEMVEPDGMYKGRLLAM